MRSATQREWPKSSLELRLGEVRGRQHRRRSQKTSSRHFSEYARILWGVREALPGTEKTIRGFSGAALLIVDEAARVDDALYSTPSSRCWPFRVGPC
jgi:hypothetical protein